MFPSPMRVQPFPLAHYMIVFLQLDRYTGTHKVSYHPLDDWDFELDTTHQHIDLSLVLPHYRARCQPVDHRMSMFLGSKTGTIKAKVVRGSSRTTFCPDVLTPIPSSADTYHVPDFTSRSRPSQMSPSGCRPTSVAGYTTPAKRLAIPQALSIGF
jgi:hypothetical protein